MISKHRRIVSYRNFFLAPSCAILVALLYATLITSRGVRAEGESATVQISGPLQPPGFSPALLTIHVNDYVVFINQSSPAATYAIAADDGSFTSPPIAPGKQWTVALNNPGEYEYHATSSPKRMLGEILVAANSISLLPTAAPEISATAIAMIEAGKTPPDNLAVPTPTPTSPARQIQQRIPLAGLWPASLPLLVESGVILLCLVTGVFFLVRSHRHRLQKRKEADTDGSAELAQARASPRRGWLGWLKKKKKDEDDEDEDEDE
jgi:plastocyanin